MDAAIPRRYWLSGHSGVCRRGLIVPEPACNRASCRRRRRVGQCETQCVDDGRIRPFGVTAGGHLSWPYRAITPKSYWPPAGTFSWPPTAPPSWSLQSVRGLCRKNCVSPRVTETPACPQDIVSDLDRYSALSSRQSSSRTDQLLTRDPAMIPTSGIG